MLNFPFKIGCANALSAGAYAEAVIRYETRTPKRSQYSALRSAYLQMGKLDNRRNE